VRENGPSKNIVFLSKGVPQNGRVGDTISPAMMRRLPGKEGLPRNIVFLSKKSFENIVFLSKNMP
jgi:hypothetical protein